MSVSLMRGVDPNGQVRTAKVTEEGEVWVRISGSSSSGGGHDSPTIEEIKTAVGSQEDQTANGLEGGYGGRFDWTIVSLLRGLFWQIERVLSGFISVPVSGSGIFSTVVVPSYANTLDSSGIIATPDQSFLALDGSSARYWLLLQNHGKLNNQTEIYEGDLWINFNNSSNKGFGSYKLPPGTSLTFENNSPQGTIYLLGTLAGIEYTLKEGR